MYSFHLATQLCGEKYASETYKSKGSTFITCLPEKVCVPNVRTPLKGLRLSVLPMHFGMSQAYQVDSKDTPESSSRTLMSSL